MTHAAAHHDQKGLATAPSRKTHLVGAWPGRSSAHAMERAFEEVGPHLLRLSDGETGSRSQWIIPTIELFRAHPDTELLRDGGYAGYGDMPKYRLREGHTLTGDAIDLGYAAAFERSYPQFKLLRERFQHPQARFQVGVPHPVDLVPACFGPAGLGDPALLEAFTQATLREIAAIDERAGDDVVFQLETVAALFEIAGTPLSARREAAGHIADRLIGLVRRAPTGTRFGWHLCLGDFRHEAKTTIEDVSPWVLLANALGERWPEGRTLDYVHAPFAAAADPPPEDESFYAPVAELRLPEGTRFVAGFIHEDVGADRLREILHMIERLYGGEVDVSCSCGLARRPDPAQAWDAMAKARELIAAPAMALD